MSISRKNKSIRHFKTVVLTIIILIIFKNFVFTISRVYGESMYPTLKEGDRLILTKYKTRLGLESFQRGDIVVFKSPGRERDYIKRIIGVANDSIDITDGKIYVNNNPVNEFYIEEDSYTEAINFGNDYIVPENMIFVVGDNRRPYGSYDSRSFGAISINAVKGKTRYRIYPNPSKLK